MSMQSEVTANAQLRGTGSDNSVVIRKMVAFDLRCSTIHGAFNCILRFRFR